MEGMVGVDYLIEDDFKARHIYKNAIFYGMGTWNEDVRVIGFSADNVEHRWREDVIEFVGLKTEVRLRLYNYPDKLNDKGLPVHSLEIEFSGEEVEFAKRRLEEMTGIGLK